MSASTISVEQHSADTTSVSGVTWFNRLASKLAFWCSDGSTEQQPPSAVAKIIFVDGLSFAPNKLNVAPAFGSKTYWETVASSRKHMSVQKGIRATRKAICAELGIDTVTAQEDLSLAA